MSSKSVPAAPGAADADAAGTSLTVGLMADPGVPSIQARREKENLRRTLSERISGVEWHVDTVDEALSIDSDGDIQLVERAPELKRHYGWDMLLYITDMPYFEGRTSMVAEVTPQQKAAAVSLPALGAVRIGRKLVDTLTRLVEHLYGGIQAEEGGEPVGDEAVPDDGSGRPHSTPSSVTPLDGAEYEAVAAGDTGIGEDGPIERVSAPGRLRGLRLLSGMVRSNRPLRLPLAMTTAMAAAIGTGAFGIFYGTIWTLSDEVSGLRHVFISVLVLTGMTLWLITANRLWASSGSWSSRRWAAMDNAVTIICVGMAVVIMYLGLFLVLLSAAVVVIPPHYLADQLVRPAGFPDYLQLSWLAASMGTMAGAVGSSFDDDDAIRNGTYSRRESARRRLFQAQQEKKKREEQGEAAEERQSSPGEPRQDSGGEQRTR